MSLLAWRWHAPGSVLVLDGLPTGWQVVFHARRAGFRPEEHGVQALRQVHGTQWVEVHANQPPPAGRPRADAWIVTLPGLQVGIQVADCLPGFVADPQVPVFALFHAGWKGTHQGLLPRILMRLQALGARPHRLMVAYGPAIRGCHYEVGPEFETLFPGFLEHRHGRRFLDLFAVHRRVLQTFGVPDAQILPPPFCTYEHPDWFYSYRRERETGRMWMVAGFRGVE